MIHMELFLICSQLIIETSEVIQRVITNDNYYHFLQLSKISTDGPDRIQRLLIPRSSNSTLPRGLWGTIFESSYAAG